MTTIKDIICIAANTHDKMKDMVGVRAGYWPDKQNRGREERCPAPSRAFGPKGGEKEGCLQQEPVPAIG